MNRIVVERLSTTAVMAVVEGEHRHYKTWRAKSALAAMGIDQRLLHRMEGTVCRGEPLDCQYLFAVGLTEESNTTVNRPIADAAVDGLANRHRASRAIAFGTPFLGAAGVFHGAQVFEDRQIRRKSRSPTVLTVKEKANLTISVVRYWFLPRGTAWQLNKQARVPAGHCGSDL